MTANESCPSANQLQGLLAGQAPPEEQAHLANHLETCETCRQTLEELVAGSQSWSDAARQLKDEPPPSEPKLRQIIDKIKNQAKEGETQDDVPRDEEMSLDFLSPPEEPGHLGRLKHYEVLEVIGRGGMGIVLKGFDTVLHRIVAIKVLAPQLATTTAARKRFEREARTAAAISHEHVVAIYAVDETNGLPYLVMEYVSGASLQERLDRTGPLELNEILRIGLQTARGLTAAHKQGLVHRDIKPANILLYNGVERVKITDFGLARVVDDASLTQSGIVAGTPQYMAPEQARGESVDHRADLFSLGSVLYAMCAGRPPFRASTALAVLKRVSEETPRPLTGINPAIPAWLIDIIDKLHAKDPVDRFQSAAEVAELLNHHLAHLQQPGQAISPWVTRPESSTGVRAAEDTRRSKILGVSPRYPRWVAAALLLPLIAGGFVVTETTGITKVTEFVGTVLRINTSEGWLVVQVDDPQVEITVDGDELTFHGAGTQKIQVKAGQYRVRASKDGQAIPVDRDLVTITRGGKQIVKVSQEGSSQAGTANVAGKTVSFRFGEIVQARFFLRNAGKNLQLRISYPRLITQSYYKALRVIDSEGQEIKVQQADQVPVPVGWVAGWLGVGGHAEIAGPFLSIGDNGDKDTGAETLLRVRPGQTYRLQYTLPNYGDANAGELQTGEFSFTVLDKRAPADKQLTAEELNKHIAWGKPGKNGLQIGVLLVPYQPPGAEKIERNEKKSAGMVKESQTAQQSADSEKTRQILQERYATLKQIAEQTERHFEAGRASEGDLLQARLQVLKAQLDLAESDSERVKIQEQIVAQMKKLEEILDRLFQAGSIVQKDVLQARADRLQAERELQELRQKLPESAQSGETTEKIQDPAQARSIKHLETIGRAMRTFHEKYHHFPPTALYSDGKPLLSWRVLILPFLGEEKLYKEFNLEEPWDSPHNSKLLAKRPKVFAPPIGPLQKGDKTFYRTLAGMIVEAGEPVPWTQPEELDYKPGKSPPSLGGIFPDRFHVLTRHGFVLAVKKEGFNERKMRLLLLSNERPDADISELRP